MKYEAFSIEILLTNKTHRTLELKSGSARRALLGSSSGTAGECLMKKNWFGWTGWMVSTQVSAAPEISYLATCIGT